MSESAPEVVWDKETDVPKKWIQFVDANVVMKLPQGIKIKGIASHGASYWTRTAKILTEQADGSALCFFIKVTQDDIGKGMVSGEFVSMTALYTAIPDLTPMPIAWGTYASDANVHFFLCSFVDMTNEIPDLETLPEKIAKLHEKAFSPNGKYGFSVPTYQGRIPQEVAWKDTWEEFFLASLKRILTVEETSQGSDAEMKQLTEQLIKRVVPRLLRPLETGGRQVQPRLVHGDLWDGNTSTDITNNLPIIFDATSIYAHNELELAPWKPIRHKIGKPYIEAYHRYFPISPPKEDHDDRITLYCLRFNAVSSALYPGNLRFRHLVVEDMRSLVEKFPGGYEEWEKRETNRPAE